MPVEAKVDQPRALLELLEYPDLQDLKEAFLYAVLMIPRVSGLSIAPEKHGLMTSLGVYRNTDWCFSIKPTKHWIKVWIRRPELNSHKVGIRNLNEFGFDVKETNSKELTIQLLSFAEMESFVQMLEFS